MRLTHRCEELLRLLQASRWLTTSQVHRRFFGKASLDAARKRLQKLTAAGFLVKLQENQMHEAFFRLGPEGKRFVERHGAAEVVVERRLPKQREHFVGINDVRLAADVHPDLEFFFACWELPGLGWKHSTIPDAVFSVSARRFALEFDRDQEALKYFAKTKVAAYNHGLPGFPLTRLLILVDREARMRSLMKSVTGSQRLSVLFSTIDAVREQGLWAPIWELPSLLSASPGVKTVLVPEASGNQHVNNLSNTPLQEEEIRDRI
jgi:hypothetical protein